MHPMQETNDGIGSLGSEKRLYAFHRWARLPRAVRSKTALIAKFADALNGYVQSLERLPQATPHLNSVTRIHGQKRQMLNDRPEKLGEILSVVIMDGTFLKHGAAGAFDEHLCQVESEAWVLDDCLFKCFHMPLNMSQPTRYSVTGTVHDEGNLLGFGHLKCSLHKAFDISRLQFA